MSSPNPQQRRWFQFSLRTLLVLVAAAAGLAFAWMKLVEPYRLQREAMAAITKLGGTYKTERRACAELEKCPCFLAIGDFQTPHGFFPSNVSALQPPEWLNVDAGTLYFAEPRSAAVLYEPDIPYTDPSWLANLESVFYF